MNRTGTSPVIARTVVWSPATALALQEHATRPVRFSLVAYIDRLREA